MRRRVGFFKEYLVFLDTNVDYPVSHSQDTQQATEEVKGVSPVKAEHPPPPPDLSMPSVDSFLKSLTTHYTLKRRSTITSVSVSQIQTLNTREIRHLTECTCTCGRKLSFFARHNVCITRTINEFLSFILKQVSQKLQ